MAEIQATPNAFGRGYRCWCIIFADSVAQTVRANAYMEDGSGTPAPGVVPQRAIVFIRLQNGTERAFNLLDHATLDENGINRPTINASTDGLPGILGKGDQLYNGVNVKAATGRAQVIDARMDYVGP